MSLNPPTNVAVNPTPVDGLGFVTWTSPVNATGQNIVFIVAELSVDGGVTWNAMFTTGLSSFSWTYDFTSVAGAPSSTCIVQISVVEYDATTFAFIAQSAWAQSATFTINRGPVMTYPNGGQTFAVGVPQTLAWTPGSDTISAASAMKYHLQISPNGGITWQDIVALTSAGVTTYSYNFAGLAVGSNYMIRIQDQDAGGNFGTYHTTGTFTLVAETAPLQPTNLSPVNTIIADSVFNRFSWQFNDLGDVQSKFAFNYSTNGGASFTTVTVISSNPYFDVPPLLSPPGAATLAAGSTGSPNGAYRTVVTFLSALGETSAGTEADITVSSKQINWSNLPIGPAGTIGRRLYRTVAGGAAGTEKLVTTINDNSTTSFTDNVADGSLGATVPSVNTSGLPTGPLIWSVVNYNAAGTASPTSMQASITVSRQPATPTITAPSGTVTQVRPTITWTFTTDYLDAQVAFTATVSTTGGTVLWTSGLIRSNSPAAQVGMNLSNGTTYVFGVTIQNADGFTSNQATVTESVSFSVPATPTLTVTADQINGRIIVAIANGSGPPPTASCDLYRTDTTSGGNTIRIATGLSANSTYYDYSVKSGHSYTYYAIGYAPVGTISTSATSAGVSVTLLRAYLHDVSNPVGTSTSFTATSEDDTFEYQMVTMELFGCPVEASAYGIMRRRFLKANLGIASASTDYANLLALWASRPPVLCFRDQAGNKIFCGLSDLPADWKGSKPGVIGSAIELNEVQFLEGV
jgi:hypothetical protein